MRNLSYYLWTIGCQMNFADSRRAAEELERIGYQPAERPQDADLILLNTCVVRQSAQDKVTGRLTSLQGLKRRRPDLTLVLMGCYVDEIPALEQQFPWVDSFIKPSDIESVVALARGRLGEGTRQEVEPETGLVRTSGVSAGVPISFGCDHLCTYCIVRLRRGAEVSRPLGEIEADVQRMVQRGIREVTLLGQNVDSYGHDLSPLTLPASSGATEVRTPDLADLLLAVHLVAGLLRIRFLTSHPGDMSDRVIEAAARLPKVCEHMELPVQSGDDLVLRRMGRGYTVDQYRERVSRIRSAMPGVGLATDVIVGFPGESEPQFTATYRLLEEIRFDVVHVAPYSPRPGTPAERLPDDVPAAEKERRRKAVDLLQERIAGEINARLLDQTVEILVEGRHKGKWMGRTRTNKLVFFDIGDQDWTGQLVSARITRTGPWSMQATLASCGGTP